MGEFVIRQQRPTDGVSAVAGYVASTKAKEEPRSQAKN
jgi:hypothetical protein